MLLSYVNNVCTSSYAIYVMHTLLDRSGAALMVFLLHATSDVATLRLQTQEPLLTNINHDVHPNRCSGSGCCKTPYLQAKSGAAYPSNFEVGRWEDPSLDLKI